MIGVRGQENVRLGVGWIVVWICIESHQERERIVMEGKIVKSSVMRGVPGRVVENSHKWV